MTSATPRTPAERLAAHRARRAQWERDTAAAFLASLGTWDFAGDELDPAILSRELLVEALTVFADDAEAAYWEVRDGNDNAVADYENAMNRWATDLVKWQLRRANAIAAGRRMNARYNPDDARPKRPTRPHPEAWEPIAAEEGYPARPVAIGPRRAVALLRELGPAHGLREVRRATGRFYAFAIDQEDTQPMTPEALHALADATERASDATERLVAASRELLALQRSAHASGDLVGALTAQRERVAASPGALIDAADRFRRRAA